MNSPLTSGLERNKNHRKNLVLYHLPQVGEESSTGLEAVGSLRPARAEQKKNKIKIKSVCLEYINVQSMIKLECTMSIKDGGSVQRIWYHFASSNHLELIVSADQESQKYVHLFSTQCVRGGWEGKGVGKGERKRQLIERRWHTRMKNAMKIQDQMKNWNESADAAWFSCANIGGRLASIAKLCAHPMWSYAPEPSWE